MSKQTAVKWLVEQLFKQGYFDGNKPLSITNLDHLENQAKQMEREQIEDAYGDGLNGHRTNFCNRNEYYTKTYGKEESK
jgi:hypothetical protein